MKKLELKFGGHPLKNNDLNLLQDSYAESFKAIISIFDPSLNIILSGFIITDDGTNISCTSGYVSWQGEIFNIDSTTFPKIGSGLLYLNLVEEILSPSPVVYKDQTSQNVHIDRKLQLKYYISGDNGEYLAAFTRTSSLGFKRGMMLDYLGNPNTNFDPTGLGINDMSGFAVCNGNTFTISNGIQMTVPDLRGRSKIGASNIPNQGAPTYDSATLGNPNIAQVGGSASITISKNLLPNYNLSVNMSTFRLGTKMWQKRTRHQSPGGSSVTIYGPDNSGTDSFETTLYSSVQDGSIVVNSDGGGVPFDNRGAWYAGIPIIKL